MWLLGCERRRPIPLRLGYSSGGGGGGAAVKTDEAEGGAAATRSSPDLEPDDAPAN